MAQRAQRASSVLSLPPAGTPLPSAPAAMRRGRVLRDALNAPRLAFLMEAHDGLSAKIVEEAGFAGIWASGLSIAAALGVRDSNEASWTQVLEVLEFMADASSLPILMDGDTGYGNFNNARRLARKLAQRHVAGLCLEDKLFPKTNSFIGDRHPLADIEEFCGKIKAVKDSQPHDDFVLVARIEALIAGFGLEEALRRGEAYRRAGADAVLIHSRSSDPGEVLAFARAWRRRLPLIAVPTTYSATPTATLHEAGVSLVIWGNHNLRAAIAAMQNVCRRIRKENSVAAIEDDIAPLAEVFRLTGDRELAAAEKRYLAKDCETSAVLLAASRGTKLGELTRHSPKCMVDVAGKPILRRLVELMHRSGIRRIGVVRGYAKDKVDLPGLRFYDNDRFSETGEAWSLSRAAAMLEGACVLCYGDVLFRRYILDALLATGRKGERDLKDADIILAVDGLAAFAPVRKTRRQRDWARVSRPYTADYLEERKDAFLVEIGSALEPSRVSGEWVGLCRLSACGAARVRRELKAMAREGELESAGLPRLWQRLIDAGEKLRVVYVAGNWLDIDDAFDLACARSFA